jgi:hypothetical protein
MQSAYLIVSLLQGFYWFDSGLQSYLRCCHSRSGRAFRHFQPRFVAFGAYRTAPAPAGQIP